MQSIRTPPEGTRRFAHVDRAQALIAADAEEAAAEHVRFARELAAHSGSISNSGEGIGQWTSVP